jgi:hypothetical protein
LKPEERNKNTGRVDAKESRVKNERHLILEWMKTSILLRGSQASPSCPSDKSSVKMKKLEWL